MGHEHRLRLMSLKIGTPSSAHDFAQIVNEIETPKVANIFTSVTKLAPVVHSSQISFEKEFAKLKEAHEELDAMFQSLQDVFKKVVEKVQVTEAKVGVPVDILSNTVSRAGKIEDGLSQLVNVQLGLIDIPFMPLMSELEASPVIGVVNKDESVVNGENALETDLVDNSIINNPAYKTMD
ncbi:hypothetical protein AgCh_016172 [Apium graveolens]